MPLKKTLLSKNFLTALFCASLCLLPASRAHAWGRHDLITQIAVDSRDMAFLHETRVVPEPIEKAAPDLLARVIPSLQKWSVRFHREHDTRYAWTPPPARPRLDGLNGGASAREALLWALEDNMRATLSLSPEERGLRPEDAATILVRYVDEPDGILDGGLDRPPYLDRLRESMSVFLGNDVYTHAFRHYYVPSSLLPPILKPKGIAPYRAALYALLAQGAFQTGHPYWAYRFLAWSLHYVQDVTQPWHTVFLPGFSFLSFSKAEMKKEVSALHYLTEAFSDTWMIRMIRKTPMDTLAESMTLTDRRPASAAISASASDDPWQVAELTEELARDAHAKASRLADLARSFFQPVVDRLDDNLKPKVPAIPFGGVNLVSSLLDFSGNGSRATRCLMPVWSKGFALGAARDRLMELVLSQLDAAVGGSRLLVARVLNHTADTAPVGPPS